MVYAVLICKKNNLDSDGVLTTRSLGSESSRQESLLRTPYEVLELMLQRSAALHSKARVRVLNGGTYG